MSNENPIEHLSNPGDAISNIQFGDSPNIDGASRLRVSNPFKSFLDIQIEQLDNDNWEQLTVGGGTITHDGNQPMINLSVGTAAGDQALNQSNRYIPYNPGDSNLIKETFKPDTPKENLLQEVLYGDDDNAIGYQTENLDTQFIRRSNIPGLDDSIISQGAWSEDNLDGKGPSGITLQDAKVEFFITQFLYLGVGPIFWGFIIGGKIIWCHKEEHANNIESMYLGTPRLPLRFNIKNLGETESPSTLKQGCCAVESEGGAFNPGNKVSTPVRWANLRMGVTARVPILALRLKNQFAGKDNRKTFRILDMHSFADTNNVIFEIAHMHKPSGIVATWNDLGNSGLEFSTDITAVTGNPEHNIDGLIISATPGVGGPGAAELFTTESDAHAFISQNIASDNSQMFVVFAEGQGNADVLSGMTGLVF